LRAEGFSVWWDHGITPGAQWDQTIHNELNAAKAVIAIWSEQSVGAPWVKEEAGVGKNRGILLPIRIDDVDPPLGFSLIQMGDLIGWSGDTKDSHWRMVLAALRAIVSGERLILKARALGLSANQMLRSRLDEARALKILSRDIKNADRKLDRAAARIAASTPQSPETALAQIDMGLLIQGPYDWDDHAYALIQSGRAELSRLLAR